MMNYNPDAVHVAKVRSAGFFTKGAVYVIIGSLTLLAAFDQGGDISSTDGVVKFLLNLPLGETLGAVVALGLFAYTLWRIYQAVFLPGNTDSSKGVKTIFKRFRFFYSAVFYGLIAYSFARPFFMDLADSRNSTGSSEEGTEEKAALWKLLSTDWGELLIWILALVVAGQALWQFKLARSGKYMKKIDNYPEIRYEYDLIRNAGKFGYCARGVVFGIIAYFLVKVILKENANLYKGTEGALQYLLSFSYGPFLLGATAIGLIGYGFLISWWHAMPA